MDDDVKQYSKWCDFRESTGFEIDSQSSKSPLVVDAVVVCLMPYPQDIAKAKHNVLAVRIPPENTDILDSLGIPSTQSLFKTFATPLPDPKICTLISPVYTYPDAPPKPLSRELIIIGVADQSISLVRRAAELLSPCTIASKRADDTAAAHLKPVDRSNALRWAEFLRRLRQANCMAIVAPDKYGRLGLLQPMEDSIATDRWDPQDFAATLYTGAVEDVRQALQPKRKREAVVPTTPEYPPPPSPPAKQARTDDGPTNGRNGGNANDDDEMWKPPTTSNDDDVWKPPNNEPSKEGGDDEFWKPPGADDDDDGGWGAGGTGGGWGVGDEGNNNDDGGGWGAGEAASGDWGAGTDTGGGGDFQNNNSTTIPEEEDNAYHADKGAAAAAKFYDGLKRNMDTRAASRIFHMRAFNGWVKATQIAELNPNPTKGPKPLRILDLACGKGGDLTKWTIHRRGIGNYVGLDVARQSLVDAAIRARKMQHKLPLCTFTCADLGADVPGRMKSKRHTQMQRLLTWSLQGEKSKDSDPVFVERRGGGIGLDDTFDVVSVQFAIHYMMQTRQRARRFFRTVSELLDVGGNLIATTIDARVVLERMLHMGLDLHSKITSPVVIEAGAGACKITFEPHMVEKMLRYTGNLSNDTDEVKRLITENPKGGPDEELFGLEYTFTLVEGSDHEAGFGDAVNLPEWLIPIPVLQALAIEAGLELEYAQNFHEFYDHRKDPSIYSTSHSSMYNMKVLNRNGSISADEWDISRLYCALKFRKARESILDDKEFLEVGGEDEEEEQEIDAATKGKFMVKALLNAKRTVGGGWDSLSADDKNEIIDAEVRKLAREAK